MRFFRSLTQLETALRLAALLVLVSGLVVSAWIWRVQTQRQSDADRAQAPGLESPLENRQQLRDLEYYGGQSAVLLEEAKGLFRGKTLAKTIAVSSVLLATGLYLVTMRQTE